MIRHDPFGGIGHMKTALSDIPNDVDFEIVCSPEITGKYFLDYDKEANRAVLTVPITGVILTMPGWVKN
jgi:hypothetical protein